MIALLLTTLALADCPPLVTVPEDGEEDVPPGLQVMMVGPPTAVGHDWGLCEPESVTVLDEARNEAVVLDESWQGDAFQLSQLEPETDYTVTLEQPSTEPTVVRFRTGAARDATPVPTPVRVDSRAWSHGEEVCAEITGQVSGADRWMIIRSNVGTPQPWIRATEADQTVTLSTADAHRPVWARGQGCGGDRMTEAPVRVSVFSLVTGEEREVLVSEHITRVRDASLCPPAPELPYTPERCSALAVPGSSTLGLLAALFVALLRRRRRT